jgi:hypothetical protein
LLLLSLLSLLPLSSGGFVCEYSRTPSLQMPPLFGTNDNDEYDGDEEPAMMNALA